MRSSPPNATALFSVPFVLLIACAPPELESSYAEGFTPTVLGTLAFTENGPAGYDSALDQSKRPCLEVSERDQASRHFEVGDVTDDVDLEFIDSSTKLDSELELSAGLVAKAVATPIGGNAKFNVKNSYDESSNDVYFLIKSTSSYAVMNRKLLEFNDEAREILDGPLARGRTDSAHWDDSEERRRAVAFIGRCGTDYVNGMQYEAGIYVLLRFHTDRSTDTTGVDFEAAASGTVSGVAELATSLAVASENTSSAGTVELDVKVETFGFSPDQTLVTLVRQSDAASMATHLEALETQMRTQLREERLADTGDYFANSHSARVTQVYTRDYFSSVEPSPISDEVNELEADARLVMSECFTLYDRMVHVLYAGVERFAAGDLSYNYHLLDDSDTEYAYTLEELRRTATEQNQFFSPETGTHSLGIQSYMSDCYNDAESGSYEYCREVASAIRGETSYVDDYQQHVVAAEAHRPIVPLKYDAIDHLKTFNAAQDECDYFAALPAAYQKIVDEDPSIAWQYEGYRQLVRRRWRLPSRKEIDRLTATFMNSPILPEDGDRNNWGGVDPDQLFWMQDRGVCPEATFGANGAGVAIVDPETGDVDHQCLDYKEWRFLLLFTHNSLQHGPRAKVLCVPETGPYDEKYLPLLLDQ